MEFNEVVRRRRMVRRYRPDPVDPAVLRRVLDTARRGPSAGFSQPQRFVVAVGQAARQRIADACGEPHHVARGLQPWLSVAPVHVIPCVDAGAYDRRYAEADKAASVGPDGWSAPFAWVDGGAAFGMLLLAAVEEGLGAGFLAVDSQVLRDAAGIPEAWDPIGLVTLGHPVEDGRPGSQNRSRLDLDEIVRWAD
ncbi:nitroreductase [Euzebya pacifica]|uniref:Nitroreductase n=1 Tax=Euzebya pacifica TaxID=1608957 RepID=A0A346XZL5_9ACTN|nr:nitroreductase family protein [Euzebya pacifica]AXV07662.1 nitroreductase [Euzebya pacifica]